MAQIHTGNDRSGQRTNSQSYIVKHAMRTIARAHAVGQGKGTTMDKYLTASSVLRLLESLTAIYGPVYGGPALAMAAQLQRDLVAGLESAAAAEMAQSIADEIMTTGDVSAATLGRAAGLPDYYFS